MGWPKGYVAGKTWPCVGGSSADATGGSTGHGHGGGIRKGLPPTPVPLGIFRTPGSGFPPHLHFPCSFLLLRRRFCARKAYPLDRRRRHQQEELCVRWVCFLAASQGGCWVPAGSLVRARGFEFSRRNHPHGGYILGSRCVSSLAFLLLTLGGPGQVGIQLSEGRCPVSEQWLREQLGSGKNFCPMFLFPLQCLLLYCPQV